MMSRYYGTFSSDCTKDSTKRGHSFVSAHVRGWNIGIRCEVRDCPTCGADMIVAYKTGGSNSRSMFDDGNEVFSQCSADCQNE